MTVLTCPVCASVLIDQETKCPSCGTDLDVYSSLFYTPDLLYNEAVDLLQKQEYNSAIDKLAIAHYLRPADKEIVLMMAKSAELSGNIVLAMEKMAVLLVGDYNVSEEAAKEFERLTTAYEQQEADRLTEKAVSTLSDERFAELKIIVKQAIRDSIIEINTWET